MHKALRDPSVLFIYFILCTFIPWIRLIARFGVPQFGIASMHGILISFPGRAAVGPARDLAFSCRHSVQNSAPASPTITRSVRTSIHRLRAVCCGPLLSCRPASQCRSRHRGRKKLFPSPRLDWRGAAVRESPTESQVCNLIQASLRRPCGETQHRAARPPDKFAISTSPRP